MKIVEEKRFGAVRAIKLGFGPLGPPLMCVHLFYLDGLVIDSGQRHMQKAVLELLSGSTVAKILLTHHHEDHSGNAAAISKSHNAPVFGHPVTAEKMKRRFPIKPYQRYVWGHSESAEVSPLPKIIESDGYTLVPVHCPGHSRDHIAYLEPNHGWLFSGDLFLGERIKFFRSDEVFQDQIVSIKNILAHDFEALFCAHNPCAYGGKSRLRNKLQFLEELYGDVQQMKAAGHSAKAAIRRLDHKNDRIVKWFTMGNVSFANMVRSAYEG